MTTDQLPGVVYTDDGAPAGIDWKQLTEEGTD